MVCVFVCARECVCVCVVGRQIRPRLPYIVFTQNFDCHVCRGVLQMQVCKSGVLTEIVRSSLDGHAGAVETKRPESLLSFETLISCKQAVEVEK